MSFYPFKSAELEFKINMSVMGPSCYYVMAHEREVPGYSYDILLLVQHRPGASYCPVTASQSWENGQSFIAQFGSLVKQDFAKMRSFEPALLN